MTHVFNQVIDQMENNQLMTKSSNGFEMTSLGLGTFRSTLTLNESMKLSEILQTALEDGIILIDDLHILYLCALPIDGNSLIEPNYIKFFDYLEQKATLLEKKIMERCKIPHHVLVTKAMNKYSKIADADAILIKRFYNAFILRDIINEQTSFMDFCEVKGRGVIQQLMSQSAMFCNMVQQFCDKINYWQIAKLLKPYIARIQFGAKSDIVELVQLEGVNRAEVARILSSCELNTVDKIASFVPQDLMDEEITMSLQEFENPSMALSCRKFFTHLTSTTHLSAQTRTFVVAFFTQERIETILHSAVREINKRQYHYRQKAEALNTIE